MGPTQNEGRRRGAPQGGRSDRGRFTIQESNTGPGDFSFFILLNVSAHSLCVVSELFSTYSYVVGLSFLLTVYDSCLNLRGPLRTSRPILIVPSCFFVLPWIYWLRGVLPPILFFVTLMLSFFIWRKYMCLHLHLHYIYITFFLRG